MSSVRTFIDKNEELSIALCKHCFPRTAKDKILSSDSCQSPKDDSSNEDVLLLFEILSSLFILAMPKRAEMAYAYIFKYIIIGDPSSLIESSSLSTRIQVFLLLVQVLVNLLC